MKNDIIQHIISSKNLLYKEENIQQYLDIVQDRIYIRNPFDRAIAVIFELVIEKEINPHDIDLVSFSKLYTGKVKKEGIDLFIAGKIVLMAWKILRLQSEELIGRMEKKDETDEYDEVSQGIPDWYGEDDVFTFTKKVMKEDIPLDKKIRRVPNRKVTLVELINAFEEAKDQITKRAKKRRNKEKEWANIKNPDTMHKEDIEFDMKFLMNRLSKLNGQAIPLKNLYENRDEMLTMWLPLLFLAKEGRIMVWQDNFPFGEIFIKMNHGS